MAACSVSWRLGCALDPKDAEALVETSRDVPERQHRRPRRRQFECERKAVERSGYVCGYVALVRSERRPRLSPIRSPNSSSAASSTNGTETDHMLTTNADRKL